MPTFRSIGVKPTVSNRLVTESVLTTTPTTTTTTTSTAKDDVVDCNGQSNLNNGIINNNNSNKKRQYHSIGTPHAMLCRNPASLKLLKIKSITSNDGDETNEVNSTVNPNVTKENNDVGPDSDENCVNDQTTTERQSQHQIIDYQDAESISFQQALCIRHDIAVAIMKESYSGKVLEHIRNEISTAKNYKQILKQQQSSSSLPICVTNDTSTTSTDSSSMKRKKPIAFPGTISVFEMLQYNNMMTDSVLHSQQTDKSNFGIKQIVVSTGCKEIDEIVSVPDEHRLDSSWCYNTSHRLFNAESDLSENCKNRGVPLGYVTQLSGPSGCGKTQLALQLAAYSVGIYQTWYLSSDAAVHCYAQRLAQIAYQFHTMSNNDNSNVNEHEQQQQQQHCIDWMNIVLNRTYFSHVTNEFEVLAELNRLDSFLLRNNDKDENICRRPILLIIDSVAECITIGDNTAHDTLLPTVANTIKRMTRLHSLATFMINGTVSNTTTRSTNFLRKSSTSSSIENETVKNSLELQQQHRTSKPALGRGWLKSAADIQLWIDTVQNKQLRYITLDRHPSKKLIPTGHLTGTLNSKGFNEPHTAIIRVNENGVFSAL
jgi:archaellum biogenesis ATPase FlaH